jgi:hypothetical protein
MPLLKRLKAASDTTEVRRLSNQIEQVIFHKQFKHAGRIQDAGLLESKHWMESDPNVPAGKWCKRISPAIFTRDERRSR